jgi:hypothetical protein
MPRPESPFLPKSLVMLHRTLINPQMRHMCLRPLFQILQIRKEARTTRFFALAGVGVRR